MTIYIESNFVLELALEQEEHGPTSEILAIAVRGGIQLAFPAFCICEPFETLERRRVQRDRLSDAISREMRELSRSGPHNAFAATFKSLAVQLSAIKKIEMESLERTLGILLKIAHVIPVTSAVFDQALIYEQQHSLTPQDAMVYASVISDLKLRATSELKCFLSRNPKDFDDPTIDIELKNFNCRYIARFTHGLDFIRNKTP